MVGSVALAVQARRLAQERDKSERIAGFLKELFTVADPMRSRGNSVTAREILDEGVKKIDATLADDPQTRGDLLGTMGDVYQGLGLYAEAERLSRQASPCTAPRSASAHATTQRKRWSCRSWCQQLGRTPMRRCAARTALTAQQRTLGDDHALTPRPRTGSGWCTPG